MKKNILSLAALMLIAAPIMTSCSNDLDEAAPVEEVKSNVVSITIAPPATTRVAMDGVDISGWADGDVVNLYKATPGQGMDPMQDIWEEFPARVSGTGVAFTCTNASTGTFRGTLPDDENIDDYNLAIFGGTAENIGSNFYGYIKISPTTWSSTDLKDVVMMGALKEGASFTMQVINNVMKIENQSGADVTVAWYGYDFYPEVEHYFELACRLATTHYATWQWMGQSINDENYENPTWADVPHFTLVDNSVNYVNFPMVSGYEDSDKIGLYMSDRTAVVPMKVLSGRVSDEYSQYCGNLLDAGTFGSTGGSVEFKKSNTNISWTGSATSTLTGTDVSGISITFNRPDGRVTRSTASGNITFASPSADETITISVSNISNASVTNSDTSKTLEGGGPWTLTYKTTPEVTTNGWYTSGGELFIMASTIPGTALTVNY